ncbi:MAG: hypothetical protein R3A52_31530 [Polyangiales bacterium]
MTTSSSLRAPALAVALLSACGGSTTAPPSSTARDATTVDVTAATDAPAVDGSANDVPTVPDASSADASADVELPCGEGHTCPEGFRCVGLSTARCVRAAAVGAPCRNDLSDPIYCVPGASCEPAEGGSRCFTYGAQGGVCRNTDGCSPVCDPGLGCDPSTHCRPGLAPGALCGGVGDFCNDGASCQDIDGTRRCVADGADRGYCGFGRTCAAGLRCDGVNSGSATGCNREYFHCGSGVALWAACTPGGDPCVAGARCETSRGETVCVAHSDGTPGGRCRATEPSCDDGATCGSGGWACVRRLARGERCEPSGGLTACADGDSCTAEHRGDVGRCVAPGSAPGADCRETDPPCDGDLACSDFSRYRRTCRTVARVGDPCDLGGIQTLCPESSQCLPTTVSTEGAVTATCAQAVPEVEPNERGVSGRAVVDRSALYRSSLSSADVEDCHALRVPAGAALFVESTLPVVAHLYGSAGVELGRWTPRAPSDGGPLSSVVRLDPASVAALRELAAGDYLLCVRSAGALGATPTPYTLAVGVLPRSW